MKWPTNKTANTALMLSAFWVGLGLGTGSLSPTVALAEIKPKAVKADERIRTVPFQKDNIVYLSGMRGVSTMIVFNDDEEIATIAMGDTLSWQAIADQSKKFLFIKPLDANAVTNMNVITTKRVYNFMLRGAEVGNSRNAIVKLRFQYPDDEADRKLLAQAERFASQPNLQAAMARPEGLNYKYGYKGSKTNKPVTIFDDGVKTFFEFNGDIPGIFAVKADRSETLINYRREGNYIVVDKVATQWTLRSADGVTCVFNTKNLPRKPIITSHSNARSSFDR